MPDSWCAGAGTPEAPLDLQLIMLCETDHEMRNDL